MVVFVWSGRNIPKGWLIYWFYKTHRKPLASSSIRLSRLECDKSKCAELSTQSSRSATQIAGYQIKKEEGLFLIISKHTSPQQLLSSHNNIPTILSSNSHLYLNSVHTDWTAVATWRWIANDDNCGICRMPFESCCTECSLPGDDCPLVWGSCTHCFHMHCIVKWLNSQVLTQQCPMCRQAWKFNDK